MILFVLLNEVFRYFFSTHSTSNSHESIINVIGQLDVLDLKREESYQRTKTIDITSFLRYFGSHQ